MIHSKNISDAINSTAHRAAGPVIGEELAALVADLRTLLSRDQWRETPELQTFATRLDGLASKAKTVVTSVGEGVADRARTAARTTDDWVHEEPWTAIGIAAAVGLGVGLLVARR